jgi:hypothetical protein
MGATEIFGRVEFRFTAALSQDFAPLAGRDTLGWQIGS